MQLFNVFFCANFENFRPVERLEEEDSEHPTYHCLKSTVITILPHWLYLFLCTTYAVCPPYLWVPVHGVNQPRVADVTLLLRCSVWLHYDSCICIEYVGFFSCNQSFKQYSITTIYVVFALGITSNPEIIQCMGGCARFNVNASCYVRDLSIFGFWYLCGILKPMPFEYQG